MFEGFPEGMRLQVPGGKPSSTANTKSQPRLEIFYHIHEKKSKAFARFQHLPFSMFAPRWRNAFHGGAASWHRVALMSHPFFGESGCLSGRPRGFPAFYRTASGLRTRSVKSVRKKRTAPPTLSIDADRFAADAVSGETLLMTLDSRPRC